MKLKLKRKSVLALKRSPADADLPPLRRRAPVYPKPEVMEDVRAPQSKSSKRRPSEGHSPKRQSRSVERALRKIAEELADSPKPKSSRSRSSKAESPDSPKARSCSRSSKVESPESPQPSRWVPPPATELKHRSRSRSAAGKSPNSPKTELSASPPEGLLTTQSWDC